MHPDAAWSDCYLAPEGHETDPCRHGGRRCRLGPTSRRRGFSIVVDTCGWCGRILRSHQDLTWQEYFWVRRSNNRHG